MENDTNKGISGDDSRLLKSSGDSSRRDRSTADIGRTQQNGTILSSQERRAALREAWIQESLPKPPDIPGYHSCWLSNTNPTDSIFKRQQLGYELVRSSEVPGFDDSFFSKEGQYDGYVVCREMVLSKIPLERYHDIMMIHHVDMPLEQEGSLREQLEEGVGQDKSGKNLGSIEGDGFQRLGIRQRAEPQFT